MLMPLRVLLKRRALERSCRWTRAELHAHQLRSLQALRQFACRHSPFYRRFHRGVAEPVKLNWGRNALHAESKLRLGDRLTLYARQRVHQSTCRDHLRDVHFDLKLVTRNHRVQETGVD